MPKFHETKKFIEIDTEWKEKLEQSGFDDIEDEKGNLRTPDCRTQNFVDRVAIAEFFRRLRWHLSDHSDIPEKQRQILELYAEGTKIKKIASEVRVSRQYVGQVVQKFRENLIART